MVNVDGSVRNPYKNTDAEISVWRHAAVWTYLTMFPGFLFCYEIFKVL